MKKIDFAGLSAALLIGVTAYFGSNNVFIGVGVLIIFVAYYFLLARKSIIKYSFDTLKAHYCYQFINSFLVTLSIKESLDDAYESGVRNAQGDFLNYVQSVAEMNVMDRLVHLREYFNLSVYHMFINVVNIYQEQGGNILKISESLMGESMKLEDSVSEAIRINNKKIGEFIILWALTFVVLLFMRFALSSFYFSMLKSKIFIVLLIVFYVVVLLSAHIFIKRVVRLPLKEESVHA